MAKLCTPRVAKSNPVLATKVIGLLKAARLRRTAGMIDALAILMTSNEPLSAKELHKRMGSLSIHPISYYRMLARFEQAGLVRLVHAREGALSYFPAVGETAQYPVIFRDSDKTEVIDGDLAAAVSRSAKRIEAILRRHGYSELSHAIQFVVSKTPPNTREAPAQPIRTYPTLTELLSDLRTKGYRRGKEPLADDPTFAALEELARAAE